MGNRTRLGRLVVAATAAATALGVVGALPLGPTATTAGAEPTGTAGFSEVDADVTETAGSVRLTVFRSGLAAAPGTVDYATRDGSAKGGLDFGAAAGTVTFGVGEVAKTIAIGIVDDRLVEPAERFEVVLSNPRGAIGSVGSPVVVIIQDDDGQTARSPAVRQSMDSATGSAAAVGRSNPAPQRRRIATKVQSSARRAARPEPIATPFEVRTPAAAAPLPPAATTGGGGMLALLAAVLLGSVAARVWMRWLLSRSLPG